MNSQAGELDAAEDQLRQAYDAPAPLVAPETYPGPIPDWSFRLNNEGITLLQGYQVAKWTAGRVPVLAVGSNASPAQLRHKFESQPDLLASLPVTRAIVTGIASVYTPYRASYGSIPTPPHNGGDLRSVLSILWLNEDQLTRLEPLLVESVVTGDAFLDEVTTHLLAAGGKRLRPVLAPATATSAV